MEYESEYETVREMRCPHCHRKSKYVVRGVVYGEIESPEEDGPDL